MPGIPNRPFPLKRIVAGLVAVAAVVAAAALLLPREAEAKDAIGLDAKQKADVQRAQVYLNAITSMRSRFLQITNTGQFSEGEILIQRPGKMRIDYDPPVPVLIVSDGSLVMYKDEELDQLSYTPLSSTPASLFLGETVDFFQDDLLITDFEHETGVLRITLQRTEDPMEGSLELAFDDKPMQLRKWTVVDAQGVVTTVSLQGPRFGETFGPDTFKVEHRALQTPAN
ncbi:MAG: outer membrane lipoprotein carrier protein LolA [Alphaproteobacteria bacterium]|nr:outer membrane lipoprotein carrier protein LolA [Alphaproteobacteria bacterium]MBF0250303.1 outer membrane lipoprotein carrier protein LolA [Alphaproteobacteria bacterium]